MSQQDRAAFFGAQLRLRTFYKAAELKRREVIAMRKFVVLLLAITLCFSMVACSGNSSLETEPKQGDLKKAVSLIKEAEEIAVSMGNTQLSNWTTSLLGVMRGMFTDSGYEVERPKGWSNKVERGMDECHQGRKDAKNKLESARNIIAIGGSGDEYQAVKEYYSQVSALLTFVSTYPEGYSEHTFTTTLAEYKKDCQTAYSKTQLY